jgi:hypothetical protein
MNYLPRVIVAALTASLLGACGGGGSSAAAPPAAAAPVPVESHDWDSWNWDEGSFGD